MGAVERSGGSVDGGGCRSRRGVFLLRTGGSQVVRVQINPAQQLGVQGHHDGRGRHQDRAHGRGQHEPDRGEHAGGQRHGEDVVARGPDEVLDHLAVAGLRELNHRQHCTRVITGQDLGINEVFAEVLPQDKDTKVTQLQERGLSVAMVGDGVNDAPALTRAEVGIAIGAGTDVAMESAGVVLASDDPRAMLSMIELSQASYRKMIQNLIWASGYNILAVPLAAGVLASSGILLPPAAAAVLMSLSTIVVALNAQLLRRIDLDPAHLAPTSPKEKHTTPTPASTAVH